jgi:sensor histidine kinase YesM
LTEATNILKNRIGLYSVIGNIVGTLIFLAVPFIESIETVSNITSGTSKYNIWRDLFSHFLVVCFFYLNYFVIIPKYYFKKQIGLYILVVLSCYVVVTVLPVLLIHTEHSAQFLSEKTNYINQYKHEHEHHLLNYFWVSCRHSLFTFGAAFLISLLFAIDARFKRANKEKMDAEVKFFKAQINPHFLFNTLNGIYALALEKSDTAPDAISKLSSIMRYATNEVKRDQVPLIKEIEYLKDYVDLQIMRLGETSDVKFEITGNYSNVMISPLILITFIENAFKYGVSTEDKHPIYISLHIEKQFLQFKVHNQIVRKKKPNTDAHGLENAKQQLDLIYSKRHNLQITDDGKEFKVHLDLDLI